MVLSSYDASELVGFAILLWKEKEGLLGDVDVLVEVDVLQVLAALLHFMLQLLRRKFSLELLLTLG